jgi:hypothetical protein
MKILKKIDIPGCDIYIAANDNGELRVGSERQLRLNHMPALPLLNDAWVSILADSEHWQIHLQKRKDSWWCNVGKTEDLPPDNKEFPWLLFSNLLLASFEKQAQEYKEEVRSKWPNYSK